MNASSQTKTFTTDQVVQALESKGIPCQVEGRQVNADLAGSGHHHIKISPHKGLFLDANTGKGGTISSLLRQVHAEVTAGATAPAHPAAGGHERGTTTHAAQRIWGSAWTCTHSQDMPAGWDKGLNAAQKGHQRTKIGQQRDIVRAYLTARLGPDHLDHWSRQVRIGRNGLMLTPMLKLGQAVGIQRTFFDESGQKAERKMLGKHGVQVLTPPPGVTPHDLGVGKVILIAEGWETTAAAVQATGWPGVCVYAAGGMIKWAEQQAIQAKGLTQNQIAQAPAVVTLVDRDESQTGQKAAARSVKILRAAGLKAYYAIPPSPENGGPKGGEKGSDWGDYPREGMGAEVLAAHLALAIALGDREMREQEEMSSSRGSKWRPAADPVAPVDTVPTAEAREGLQTELQKTVEQYLGWLKDKEHNHAPLVLMQPTMGVGKSTAAKALCKNVDIKIAGGSIKIFVPDHAQANEYEEAGYFHFWGRNPDPSHPGYCPAYKTLEETMATGHVSQAELCHRCSNGFAWQIEYYEERNKDKAERAKKLLADRGLDWQKVEPCVWQGHLREALDAQFVVAVSGSYSHSLTRDALVIFDEHFDVGKSLTVTLQNIDHWSRRNQNIISTLGNMSEESTEALAQHRKADEFFKALALAMAGWVGKTGAIQIDPKLLEAIQGILEAAKKSRKDEIDVAKWETLHFDQAGELEDNPLRAAHALAESMQFGDGYVEKGQIIVAHSLLVMDRLAQRKPTVIMDATPYPVVVAVVQAQGGQVVAAVATQNVRITRFPNRFWGLSALKIGPRMPAKRVAKEIAKYQRLIKHYDPDLDEKTAFLVHNRAEDRLIVETETADGAKYRHRFDGADASTLGHWGKHHRAHNRWTNRPLVIVGSFFPPMLAWRSMYQASRIAALAAGAQPKNWPAWPDDMEMQEREWVSEGDHEVFCYLPLPVDAHVRAWLLSRITAEIVQAIGRVRGANAGETVDVHIFGGVPLFGLGQHGLSVAEYAADPECLGPTEEENWEDMQEQHQCALDHLDRAASSLIARGETITRKSLQNEAAAAKAVEKDGAGYLFHPGIYIHTGVEQMETGSGSPAPAPRNETVQEWIAARMPILSSHLSTRGRNGMLIKAARAAAQKFGAEMLAEAMQIAESLVKSTGNADAWCGLAWNKIEGDAHATTVELVGARLLLEALGQTEGVPPPWKTKDLAEVTI